MIFRAESDDKLPHGCCVEVRENESSAVDMPEQSIESDERLPHRCRVEESESSVDMPEQRCHNAVLKRVVISIFGFKEVFRFLLWYIHTLYCFLLLLW